MAGGGFPTTSVVGKVFTGAEICGSGKLDIDFEVGCIRTKLLRG